MDALIFFLKGILMTFILAVPIGPNGILVISRFLKHGNKSGFASGFGIASGDFTMGILVGIGMTALITFIEMNQIYFDMFTLAIFIAIGSYFIIPKEKNKKEVKKKDNLFQDYITSYMFTLSTPVTIIAFFSMFMLFAINTGGSMLNLLSLGAGVFCGSFLWWIIVYSIKKHIHSGKINLSHRKIDIGLSLVMFIFAIVTVSRIIM